MNDELGPFDGVGGVGSNGRIYGAFDARKRHRSEHSIRQAQINAALDAINEQSSTLTLQQLARRLRSRLREEDIFLSEQEALQEVACQCDSDEKISRTI